MKYIKDLTIYDNIIDIRDNKSYNLGHVKNAINIPKDELLNNYSYLLDKNKKYYIYCYTGYNSKIVCEILKIYGYNVSNIIDGYNNKLY